MQCCMYQVGGVFGSIPCNKCRDGTCELCTNSCSFVCQLSDYQTVLEDGLEKRNPSGLLSFEQQNSKDYLNNVLKFKSSAMSSASAEYKQLQEEGKLSSRAQRGICRATAHQASLAAANLMVHNPPAHRARHELRGHIDKIAHEKGPSWINHHGRDMNLGGTGAARRVKVSANIIIMCGRYLIIYFTLTQSLFVLLRTIDFRASLS